MSPLYVRLWFFPPVLLSARQKYDHSQKNITPLLNKAYLPHKSNVPFTSAAEPVYNLELVIYKWLTLSRVMVIVMFALVSTDNTTVSHKFQTRGKRRQLRLYAEHRLFFKKIIKAFLWQGGTNQNDTSTPTDSNVSSQTSSLTCSPAVFLSYPQSPFLRPSRPSVPQHALF